MENYLLELSKYINHSHEINKGQYDGDKGIKKWIEKRKPYLWSKVDDVEITKDKFELFVDNAYGKLVLFKNSKIIDLGASFVVSPDQNIMGVSEAYGFEKAKLFVSTVVITDKLI